jgi:Poly(A) polymerase catalytic subunit
MEEDFKQGPSSMGTTPKQTVILERLKAAIEQAQHEIDYESAHNPELVYALDVVKAFLKRRKRVCYGGTAINAVLPQKLKFYNPEIDLPDYDFFTPDQESDIATLASDLRKAGFKDVFHRTGMHEGTYKILVNFTPIADITAIQEDLYEKLYERSVEKEGVHYVDPDVLRYFMYIELSRPKGEVVRWEKVYERMQLLNRAFPFQRCAGPRRRPGRGGTRRAARDIMPKQIREKLYNFLESKRRTLVSTEYKRLYKLGGAAATVAPGPILFISPEPEKDAYLFRSILASDGDTIEIYKRVALAEVLPERYFLYYKKKLMAVVFRESACQSVLPLKMPGGQLLQIGSPDTILMMYLAVYIFEEEYKTIFPNDILKCLIQDLIDFNEKNRFAARPTVPPFPIECQGYQKGYPTLLKEKVERIRKEKAGAK